MTSCGSNYQPTVAPAAVPPAVSIDEFNARLCREDLSIDVIKRIIPAGYAIVKLLRPIDDPQGNIICNAGHFQIFSLPDIELYRQEGSNGNLIYCDQNGLNCEFEIIN